jgi:hypothetical protein
MRSVIGIFLLCLLIGCSIDTKEMYPDPVPTATRENTTKPEENKTQVTVYMEYPEDGEYRYGTSYAINSYFGSYTPPPRQGEESMAYFRAQNLTGNDTYVLIQFLSGKPNEATSEEARELYRDGVRVGDRHGNAVYARVPNSILTGKSYPFVRWMGFVEPEQKLTTEELHDCFMGNCTGQIRVEVELFEHLTVEQLEALNATTANPKSPPSEWSAAIVMDAAQIRTLAEFRNVRQIWPHTTPSLG